MKKTTKLSLALICLLSSLHAEESVILKPLSITSTAIKTDELKATEAVEIYTAKDIEKSHAQNVYDFLNQQTSIITMPANGNSFSQKIDVHGYGIGDGYQNVVITLNGRKLNNIDMNPQMLGAIAVSSIARIEIIKGSGIVLGGDGSNAAVINIITKKTNDKEVTFYGGTYGLFDASTYLGHKDKKLSVSASARTQKNGGSRDIDNKGNKDKSSLSNGNLDISYKVIEDLELRAGFSFARTDIINANSMTNDQYKNNPSQSTGYTQQLYDTDTLTAGATYFINDNLTLKADVSNEKKKSQNLTWGSVATYDYNSLRTTLKYVSDSFEVIAGIDGSSNERDNSFYDITKKNSAGFIMGEYYLGKNSFKAGYRYEKVSYHSSGDSTKSDSLSGVELGYNYAFDKKSSVFVNYAHSFQSADVDRLFNFVTGAFTGMVEPMQVDTYTLGYNHFTKTNKFKASIYYANLKNEIYYYPGVAWVGARNTNIDKSHKYGLDLYDKYIINDEFNVVLNYNYVQAIIDEEKEGVKNYDGNKLPGVSDHNIKATLSYLPNKSITLALTQNYRSEAYAADDFENNFSQKQDAYSSTDISVTYVKKGYEIFAKVNNIFNQKNGLWIKDDVIYPTNYTTTALVGFKLKY